MTKPNKKQKTYYFQLLKTVKRLLKNLKEETLEYKITKPREIFSLNPPISIEGSWMRRLTSLDLYNFIFIITGKNNKFELCTDTFDHFSFAELNDELEEIVSNPNNAPKHLQHETIEPSIVEAFEKLTSENSSTDGYLILSMGVLHLHFENLKVILEILLIWMKKKTNQLL